MTETKRDMARHALGLPNQNSEAYRNYYETSDGGQDQKDWQDMVQTGLAGQVNETVFFVSLEGLNWALDRHETISQKNMPYEDVGRQELKQRVKDLEAEIKELKEGIPIEKAKEGVIYLVEKKDQSVSIGWLDDFQSPPTDWITPNGDWIKTTEIKRVFPTGLTFPTYAFPSLPSETKEGS